MINNDGDTVSALKETLKRREILTAANIKTEIYSDVEMRIMNTLCSMTASIRSFSYALSDKPAGEEFKFFSDYLNDVSVWMIRIGDGTWYEPKDIKDVYDTDSKTERDKRLDELYNSHASTIQEGMLLIATGLELISRFDIESDQKDEENKKDE